MKIKYETPRGTRDFLPEELRPREYVMAKIENWFKKYGYQKMETPVFEYLEVLTQKSGEVENEIYSFEDKSGRKLALRFDLTVPLARVVASTPSLKLPFKRYCISRVWRYEKPQLGRFREFWQADADIVGSGSMDCEVELLNMAAKICEDLGFEKYAIHLNNRKILEGLAQITGIGKNKISDAFRSLDKLDKIGYEGVRKEFLTRGLSEKEYDSFIERIKIEGENSEKILYLEDILENNQKGREGVEEIKRILYFLDKLGLKNVLLDLTLVRGLDYYTGPIFEIKSKELKIGSFAGGGRYDRLIELYGKRSIPAVGISFGLERIIEILKDKIKLEDPPRLFIASIGGENAKIEAIKIADYLRSKLPTPVEINLTDKRLTDQLRYANSRGIKYVLIVGDQELEEKKFPLKDMTAQTEEKISLEEVVSSLQKF